MGPYPGKPEGSVTHATRPRGAAPRWRQRGVEPTTGRAGRSRPREPAGPGAPGPPGHRFLLARRPCQPGAPWGPSPSRDAVPPCGTGPRSAAPPRGP